MGDQSARSVGVPASL